MCVLSRPQALSGGARWLYAAAILHHQRLPLAGPPLLQSDLRHPSIDAKTYGGVDDIWQGRVNRDYRFYFHISDNAYRILTIIPHPK